MYTHSQLNGGTYHEKRNRYYSAYHTCSRSRGLWQGNSQSGLDPLDSSGHIARAVDVLSEANSIEYTHTSEELYQNDGRQFETQTIAESIRIFEPYVYWVKNDTTRTDNGETYRSAIEIYQIVQEDTFELYSRNSYGKTDLNAIPSLGSWNLESTEDKAAADMLIKWIKTPVKLNSTCSEPMLTASSSLKRLKQTGKPF